MRFALFFTSIVLLDIKHYPRRQHQHDCTSIGNVNHIDSTVPAAWLDLMKRIVFVMIFNLYIMPRNKAPHLQRTEVPVCGRLFCAKGNKRPRRSNAYCMPTLCETLKDVMFI